MEDCVLRSNIYPIQGNLTSIPDVPQKLARIKNVSSVGSSIKERPQSSVCVVRPHSRQAFSEEPNSKPSPQETR